TRSKRDWSSDVCSSDLRRSSGVGMDPDHSGRLHRGMARVSPFQGVLLMARGIGRRPIFFFVLVVVSLALYYPTPPEFRWVCLFRSEERRVGKGGRLGWV